VDYGRRAHLGQASTPDSPGVSRTLPPRAGHGWWVDPLV